MTSYPAFCDHILHQNELVAAGICHGDTWNASCYKEGMEYNPTLNFKTYFNILLSEALKCV